jgi:ABC-type polysaccharide/polyol phosphate export permease
VTLLRERTGRAWADLGAGIGRHWFWTALAWNDVKKRFAGSLLGSFWITINLALMVTALALVFAHPLRASLPQYIPYLTVGLVLWQFIQSTMVEAGQAFVGAGETIRTNPMPFSIQMFRLLWRNVLVLGHNMVVALAVLLAFGIRPGWMVLGALPALLLVAFILFWGSLILALLGARFRDVQQIVTGLMQLMFFLTPIIWMPSAIGPGRAWLVEINPLFALIDIVRAPLLGAAPEASSWPVAATVAAAVAAVGFAAFSAFRSRIPYWV